MGWRKLISRKATSGTFELKIGLEATESFSKIKLPTWKSGIQNKKYKPETVKLKSVTKRLGKFSPRLVIHLSLMALAGIVVFGSAYGSSNSQVASMLNQDSGYGSVIDPLAEADLAAAVADQTDLLVAPEATQTATTISSQINLPLSDDDYLAKRQVVATAGNANRGLTTHKVAPGETVASIATKYNVTTDTVKWANSLSSEVLNPGQKLTVPPITGVIHKVVAGETPELLARRYNANAAQIISFNNAEVKGLQAGQTVVIPDGIVPSTATPITRLASSNASSNGSSTAAVARKLDSGFRANGYSYGQCTYYVAGRRPIPNGWGNARSWYYNAQFSGFRVGRMPAVGAVAWTSKGYYGHVALVEQVQGERVFVTEMNYGGWNRITSRWVHYTEFGGYIY